MQKGTVLKDRVWDAIQSDPSIIDDFTKVRERYGVAIYVSNRHYDDWVRHQEQRVLPEGAHTYARPTARPTN